MWWRREKETPSWALDRCGHSSDGGAAFAHARYVVAGVSDGIPRGDHCGQRVAGGLGVRIFCFRRLLNDLHKFLVRPGYTERSTHTCARVPAEFDPGRLGSDP